MGYDLVNKYLGTPLQPKNERQLIGCTMLFSVISEALTLNGGGTAIIGVKGSIARVNDLLLKLKRCVGLYDIPVFPTPLTDIVLNLASGSGGDPDATFVTVNSESALINSRRIVVGGDGVLTSVDGGPLGTLQISADLLSFAVVDTSVSPVVINLASVRERLFRGSVSINGFRTWQLSNAANGRRWQFRFVISGLTPGAGTHDQTMPANFKMSDARVISSGPIVWRPLSDGEYEAVATTYDGLTWNLTISQDVFS